MAAAASGSGFKQNFLLLSFFLQAVTRRAPGNADMRAALAALYWAQGELAKAESEWEFACDRISGAPGCWCLLLACNCIAGGPVRMAKAEPENGCDRTSGALGWWCLLRACNHIYCMCVLCGGGAGGVCL